MSYIYYKARKCYIYSKLLKIWGADLDNIQLRSTQKRGIPFILCHIDTYIVEQIGAQNMGNRENPDQFGKIC